MNWCPQAIMRAEVDVDGCRQFGYAGDCLPPSWFDKSPDRDYSEQIADMTASAQVAGDVFQDRFRQPTSFFDGWWEAQSEAQQAGDQRQWPGLLSGFGVSLVERAMMDAAARAKGCSFHRLVHENLLTIDAARWDSELAGLSPHDWLPAKPLSRVFVRHTVGLSDPLTDDDVSPSDRLDDGQPQVLEQYVKSCGVRYFKIKVSNQLDYDMDRLESIARIIERHRDADYRVTLDGNELYAQAEDFDGLVAAIKANPSLGQLWDNTLLIEQPLPRRIALDSDHTEGIRQLAAEKPVIIDESDETLESYHAALDIGYRGVSSKACKGPMRSLLNAALTRHRNRDATADQMLVMTGEDLCCVGIVPLQTDLCLIATLGMTHVERNGHHYHAGLSYLPRAEQLAALAAHPDLYHLQRDIVRPHLQDGAFQIASLQCPGFGFAVEPTMDVEGG